MANLALADIFVRGAITFGEHYYQDHVLISPSLAEAYALEKKYAKYPRVIISPTFEDNYGKYYNLNLPKEPISESPYRPLFQYSKTDVDGFKYLDYLGTFFSERNDQSDEEHDEVCRTHMEIIVRHLCKAEKKRDFGVLSKMIWLGQYHNSYVCTRSRYSEELMNRLMVTHPRVHFGL